MRNLWMSLTLFGLVLINAATASAMACPSDEVRSFDAKVAEGEPDIFRFSYRYVCIDPSFPTVVVLPGGPGQTSSDKTSDYIPSANIVFIDPRGVGLNGSYWRAKPSAHVTSTEDLARDVIGVLKDLQPDSYFLYGHSYGTAVATVAASKISNMSSFKQPTRLILEGTVHAGLREDVQIQKANEVLKLYRENSEICFDCIIRKLQKTLSDSEVGLLLAGIFYYGYQPHMISNFLNSSDHESLERMVNALQSILPAEGLRLYRDIGCREISEIGITKEVFVEDHLEAEQDEICKNVEMSNPYLSSHWPIQAPILYIQGTLDTATPFDHAKLHYEGQRFSNKAFLCVPYDGHMPTSSMLGSCRSEIWKSILNSGGQSHLELTVEACGVGASLTSPSDCIENVSP